MQSIVYIKPVNIQYILFHILMCYAENNQTEENGVNGMG